jgi:hypothetical protein
MVQGKPPFQGSDTFNKLNELASSEHNIIVAHNAKFDSFPIIE